MVHMPVRATELLLVFVKAFKTSFEWVEAADPACRDSELHLQMRRAGAGDGADDLLTQIPCDPRHEIPKERVSERELPARPQH